MTWMNEYTGWCIGLSNWIPDTIGNWTKNNDHNQTTIATTWVSQKKHLIPCKHHDEYGGTSNSEEQEQYLESQSFPNIP